MAESRDNPAVLDEAPWSETLTPYDEAHLVTYLRLLDADDSGASTDDMARTVLGIDPARGPDRAGQAVASHLRRARWMTETGYRHLLRRPSGISGTARIH